MYCIFMLHMGRSARVLDSMPYEVNGVRIRLGLGLDVTLQTVPVPQMKPLEETYSNYSNYNNYNNNNNND